MKGSRSSAALLAMVAGMSNAQGAPVESQNAGTLTRAQSQYVLNCGGCHGIQGVALTTQVPTLRNSVGAFLCTAAGRAYIVRLPNVALARITEAQELADLMNFVVFDLGGSSTPAGAPRYSAAEVNALRLQPLTSAFLPSIRQRILLESKTACAKHSRHD